MIISASRRTDIPAFYSDWLKNRLNAGYLKVRNPFNFHQIKTIDLNPEQVDCIVFWTKNAAPLADSWLPSLTQRGYHWYFQYTINNYGFPLEPGVPNLQTTLKTLRQIAAAAAAGGSGGSGGSGADQLIRRYDPIIIGEIYNFDWHCRNFEFLAQQLSPLVNKSIFSFVDYYRKTRINLNKIGQFTDPVAAEKFELVEKLAEIAGKYGLALESCASKLDFSSQKIGPASCIDGKLIEKITSRFRTRPFKLDRHQRSNCGCVKAVDIGAYHTCMAGCHYCYANSSPSRAARAWDNHNSLNELL